MKNTAPVQRLDRALVETLVAAVQKPGRYIGGELNVIVKERAELRIAFCYPDLYEIGMANNGIRILYDIANRQEGVAAERVFAVAADFEAVLRAANVPLYTLESFTPLCALDLLGFNLSHELLATGVLQVLELGGIPLRRVDRNDEHPLVIAGGGWASNPFPMADFMDAIFVGDGEEGIVDIVEALGAARRAGMGRAGALRLMAGIEGVVLPGEYRITHDGRRTTAIEGPAAQRRVYRRHQPDGPLRPIVPNIRISQERGVVEVTRGCPNFCGFCHAGFYDLPYRHYGHEDAARRTLEIVANTGYNEVTLSSLSVSDYRWLPELLNEILPALTAQGVSVSFPSLRVDRGTLPIIEQISDLRRASLTFAVETASESMRDRANKRITDADLMAILEHVFARGWRLVKLYFMLGLPGCGDTDEAADIIALLGRVHRLGGRRVDINVTLSPFVPKPHTPFQWEGQMGLEYFEGAVSRIKRGLPRSIKVKNHDVRSSVIEAVMARGDERLGGAILAAYTAGCRLDAWEEYFDYPAWVAALNAQYPSWCESLGPRDGDEVLPWSAVVTGFEGLVARRRGTSLRPCGAGRHARKSIVEGGRIDEARRSFEGRYTVTARGRLSLTKTGMMRFVPHMDFIEIVKRGLRMARVPVAMSQGFNKRERIAAGYPVPLGVESEDELLDLDLSEMPAADMLACLNERLPAGIAARSFRLFEGKEALQAAVRAVSYRVTAPPDLAARIRDGLAAGAPGLPSELVVSAEATAEGCRLVLRAGVTGALRIDRAMGVLGAFSDEELRRLRMVKTAQLREGDGGLEPIG